MKKWRRNSGFTMAELLIVVAILGVLAGVSFVAVQNHQKSLTQAEMDSIAKEIFVAAQNHLTMAQSQNYLGLKDAEGATSSVFGEIEDNGVYHYIKNSGSTVEPSTAADMLDQILPFGSIDETVRAGNYIIRYQPKSALVLDVFYCAPNGKYSTTLENTDYSTLIGLTGDDKRSGRAKFKGSKIIGWYGGEAAAEIPTGTWLEEPQIEIVNAEKLLVKVTDTNVGNGENGVTLQLIVSGLDLDGKETGAKKVFNITRSNGVSEYTVVLDDITAADAHFAQVFSDTDVIGTFVPGQNLKIQAVAFNTSAISNIAYSDAEITNSLFEGITVNGDEMNPSVGKVITASINNIRHLENLYGNISGLNVDSVISGLTKFNLQRAVQTSDMSWMTFKGGTSGTDTKITSSAGSDLTTVGCYMPISPDYVLDYDGKNYNISDVKVNYDGNAGLFGTLSKSGSKVSNLALIDFDIKTPEASTGNAGALAGSITGTDVTNVLAYNKNTSATATNVTATNGSAGGLIGEMSGGNVSKCAVALIVSGKDAGGLIGEASNNAEVSGSYSGGHTDQAEYYNHDGDGKRTTEIYNVTATDKAGGLIGAGTGMGDIQYCYSTCSAKGNNAGGFAGKLELASGKKVVGCYATGLVKGTEADGAFVCSLTGTAENCKYFEIINERQETDGGFSYLTALGQGQSNDGVTAIDETAASYDAFSWGEADDCPWKGAMVYDKKLIEYYGATDDTVRNARYSLKTVAQLGATVQEVPTTTDGVTTPADYVTTHYGDWPAPEIFVFNTAS